MSLKEVPMWTVQCDKCPHTLANHGDEYAGWTDRSSALEIAEVSDWFSDLGGHLCPRHPVLWCEGCDEMKRSAKVRQQDGDAYCDKCAAKESEDT